MRSRCSFILFVLVLCGTSAAWGQQPVLVDPYEVLYGRRLALPKRPAPEVALKPSPPIIAAVQARTDTLLARIGAISAAFGTQSDKASVREFSDSLRKDYAAILALRDKDKIFAASWKASEQFLLAEFLTGLAEAIESTNFSRSSRFINRGGVRWHDQAVRRLTSFHPQTPPPSQSSSLSRRPEADDTVRKGPKLGLSLGTVRSFVSGARASC